MVIRPADRLDPSGPSIYLSPPNLRENLSQFGGAPRRWFLTAPWPGAKLATLSMMMTCAIVESTADAYLELTDETRRLIGEKQLRCMKPTALLIDTARGEMVDEAALVRALNEGWIAGAALDTFVHEPLPAASPLRGVDPERLILTPHNVGRSEAGRRANLRLSLELILATGRGQVPRHCVNPEAIPRCWEQR